MSKFNFCIENKNGIIYGVSENTNFNPLTVLGDLLVAAKGISCESNYERLANDFQQLFEMPCDGEDYFEYFDKMCDLRNMVLYDNSLSLAQLERLKPFFDLKFSLDIVSQERTDIKSKEQSNGRQYTMNSPLRFGFCDIETALQGGTDDEHIFMYCCHSMIDVPFAILHYLLLHEYKFRQCEHCEKYFATKSFKKKYCTRKSPYIGYEHLECGQAVDHIMKHIKKRKKSIMTTLNNYYRKAYNEFLNEYDECNLFEGKTVPRYWLTLRELERITDKRYVKEKWYREEHK